MSLCNDPDTMKSAASAGKITTINGLGCISPLTNVQFSQVMLICNIAIGEKNQTHKSYQNEDKYIHMCIPGERSQIQKLCREGYQKNAL